VRGLVLVDVAATQPGHLGTGKMRKDEQRSRGDGLIDKARQSSQSVRSLRKDVVPSRRASLR